MDLMEKLHSLMQSEVGKPYVSATEIAVVIDERVEEGVDDETRFKVCYHTRKQLGLIGAPYDGFLLSDIDKIGDNYKAVIVLAKKVNDEVKALVSTRNCFVITEENCETEVDVLRRFCKNAGVHLYSETDAVVYANANYLFVHTTCDMAISSLKSGKLELILGDKIENGTVKKHHGYLFKIVG
jgi:hypothetical protein